MPVWILFSFRCIQTAITSEDQVKLIFVPNDVELNNDRVKLTLVPNDVELNNDRVKLIFVPNDVELNNDKVKLIPNDTEFPIVFKNATKNDIG